MRTSFWLTVLMLAPGAAVAADELLLFVDYENAALDSGIVGLQWTHATAADAAFIGAPGRASRYAVGHKVLLGDPGYVSDGAPRSESATVDLVALRALDGTRHSYAFSLLLSNWQDWSGSSTPADIVWQFKHTSGEPDAFVAVRRNALILRYGASAQRTLIADIRPYDNQWIDLQFDVLWSTQADGFIKVGLHLPEEPSFRTVVDVSGLVTFRALPQGSFGYLKWGLYRPDSVAGTDPTERVVVHDNIRIGRPADPAELIFEDGFAPP